MWLARVDDVIPSRAFDRSGLEFGKSSSRERQSGSAVLVTGSSPDCLMSWVCRACRSVSIRTASNWAAARRTEPARPHGPRRPSAPVGEVPRRTRPERVPVDPFHVKPGVSDQVGARQPDHGRQKGRALDLEKRLRRAGKPKNEPVISKAAQEKKAKKAASAASPLPSHPQRHRSAKSLAVPSVTTVARLGQLLGRKIGESPLRSSVIASGAHSKAQAPCRVSWLAWDTRMSAQTESSRLMTPP